MVVSPISSVVYTSAVQMLHKNCLLTNRQPETEFQINVLLKFTNTAVN